MMELLDQANIERLIINTVTMLCKNSISYSSELRIQGTIGITVDASSVILVQLNQFEYGAEDSNRSASVHHGRGAADSIPANNYSSADAAKRPRMTSVVHCARKPVGCGRGRVRLPPVRRARSGNAITGATVSAQRARQQLAFPSSSKVAVSKACGGLPHTPVQHHATPLCTSPQFHAGHGAASIISVNEAPQQLPVKFEVEAGGQSLVEKTPHPVSSDVICVESDDEPESGAKVKSSASTSRLNNVSVKSEGESQDALQMIINRAVMAARARNTGVVRQFWILFYMFFYNVGKGNSTILGS